MARVRRDVDALFKSMSQRELTDYIHKMGKRANQRLRELEKTKHGGIHKSSNAYRYVVEKAKAERDGGEQKVFSVTRTGEVKFATATRNVSIEGLMERATQISRFLSAKSSTVKGTKATYKDSYDKWKSGHSGTEITMEEWAEIFSSAVLQNYKQQYGSEELENLVHKSKEYYMSVSEIEDMLQSVGFNEHTNFDVDEEIPLSEVYDAMSNYRYR